MGMSDTSMMWRQHAQCIQLWLHELFYHSLEQLLELSLNTYMKLHMNSSQNKKIFLTFTVIIHESPPILHDCDSSGIALFCKCPVNRNIVLSEFISANHKHSIHTNWCGWILILENMHYSSYRKIWTYKMMTNAGNNWNYLPPTNLAIVSNLNRKHLSFFLT